MRRARGAGVPRHARYVQKSKPCRKAGETNQRGSSRHPLSRLVSTRFARTLPSLFAKWLQPFQPTRGPARGSAWNQCVVSRRLCHQPAACLLRPSRRSRHRERGKQRRSSPPSMLRDNIFRCQMIWRKAGRETCCTNSPRKPNLHRLQDMLDEQHQSVRVEVTHLDAHPDLELCIRFERTRREREERRCFGILEKGV